MVFKKRNIFYGWWMIIPSFALAAYGGAAIWHSFTALFDPLIKEFAWSYTAISLAASLRGAEFGLMDLAFGLLVDRFSVRRIVLFSSILVCIGWIILSGVNSLGTFYISFFIISTGAGGLSGVVFATLLTRWFNKRLGLALGLYQCGFAIGGLAMPGVVYLLDVIGFRSAFLVFGFAALIIGSITAYFVRDWPRDVGCGPDGVALRSGEHILRQTKVAAPGDITLSSDHTLRKTLAKTAFWIITYASAASMLSIMMVTTHAMPYLEHIGYSRHTASFIVMTLPVVSGVGRLGSGWISEKIGHQKVIILALVGQLASVILFSYAHLFFVLIIFVILFGISWGGIAVIRPVALRNCFGTTYIGSIIGLCFGLTMIGSIAGPILAGWIFDTSGSYTLAWVIAGIFLLVSIPPVAMMKQTR